MMMSLMVKSGILPMRRKIVINSFSVPPRSRISLNNKGTIMDFRFSPKLNNSSRQITTVQSAVKSPDSQNNEIVQWLARYTDIRGGLSLLASILAALVVWTLLVKKHRFTTDDLIQLTVNEVDLYAVVRKVGPVTSDIQYLCGGIATIDNNKLKTNLVRSLTLRNQVTCGVKHDVLWCMNLSLEVEHEDLHNLVKKMAKELDKEDLLVATADLNIVAVDSLLSNGKAMISATLYAPTTDIKSYTALKGRVATRLQKMASTFNVS